MGALPVLPNELWLQILGYVITPTHPVNIEGWEDSKPLLEFNRAFQPFLIPQLLVLPDVDREIPEVHQILLRRRRLIAASLLSCDDFEINALPLAVCLPVRDRLPFVFAIVLLGRRRVPPQHPESGRVVQALKVRAVAVGRVHIHAQGTERRALLNDSRDLARHCPCPLIRLP